MYILTLIGKLLVITEVGRRRGRDSSRGNRGRQSTPYLTQSCDRPSESVRDKTLPEN